LIELQCNQSIAESFHGGESLQPWFLELNMRYSGVRRERGQILVMTTVSVIALFGILALAVDLGWAYYLRKSAQKAADAASMAAAIQVLSNVGNATISCGSNVTCQNPTACPTSITTPTTSEISVACLYAQQNGFTAGGNNGSQNVTVASGTTTPPPTAPGVNGVSYWVTVRVTQTSPLWFGNVIADATSRHGIGNAVETAASSFRGLPIALALTSAGNGPAARSSAGVSQGILGGTLFLLNRQNDTWPNGNPGVDLTNGGNPDIAAPGGIYMASLNNGSNNANGAYAGDLQGNPSVTAPFTYIRGVGNYHLGGSATWNATPTNMFADGPLFHDPMEGKGQPAPLPSGGQTNYVGVANGCLDCMVQPLMPGQYYAVDSKGHPTGGTLTGNANVTFSDGGSGFGNYVFYGGLQFPSPGTTVRFYPGRYVLAGAPSGNHLFSFHTGVYITDNSTAGQQNSDAGEIFIFTDPNYPGLSGNYPPVLRNSTINGFVMSDVYLQAGNNVDIQINLHGLNVDNTNVTTDLKPFAPAVFWQDQTNSRVKYTSAGYIDTSTCNGTHSLDSPCPNTTYTNSSVPGMTLQAHPNNTIYGLVYQPRGAWMTLQGNGNIYAPTIFVTGALNMQGGADLLMTNSRDTLKRRIVVLIE
jgi:Flp pilus assembly protein TadG